MVLTLNQAIEWSLTRWRHAVKTGCNVTELHDYVSLDSNDIPKNLKHDCGLCEFFFNYRLPTCKECLLFHIGAECIAPDSNFHKWKSSETKKIRKEYAKKILSDVEKVKEKITKKT